MKIKDPVVSIVMPAYNAEKYLREAIESILSQTFTDFEFIIINDGSTDRTKEIILSYDDPRIVYIENEKNSGICVTLNKGLDVARGKYIARMDSDDISLPERLTAQVEYLDKHNGIGIIGSDIIVFGEGIDARIFNQVYDENLCSAGLLFNPCFAHPSVMWRKNLMEEYNLRYEDQYRGLEDLRMWWRFAKITNLANISEPLLKYRHHPSQETKKLDEKKIEISNEFRCERFEDFGLILTKKERDIINWYSYGEYSKFNKSALSRFCNILKKILKCQQLPIRTSKHALKIVVSKAIVYTITQSSQLKGDKISLVSKAFVNGLIPPIWYVKYIKSFLI